MAKRKKHAEEHENAERWLLTYADMITLLVAFFIMLYSMSQIDLKKFAAMAGSVRAELGGTGTLNGSTGIGEGAVMGSDAAGVAPFMGPKAAADLKRQVEREVQEITPKAGIKVSTIGDEVHIKMPGNTILFPPGSAELTTAMTALLARLVPLIAKQSCEVRVSGHTCNLAPRSGRYASNWDLSSDRARNVALYLVRHHAVSADNCNFMGYADTRPLFPNSCEANRARNRRVEITLRPLNSGHADGRAVSALNSSATAGTSGAATASEGSAAPATGTIAPPVSIAPPPISISKSANTRNDH